jgi:hypothetical protein
MAKSYFVLNSDRDLAKVYQSVMLWFKGKQYEVEGIQKENLYLVQARKTSTIRTLLGTNFAFKVQIYTSNKQSFSRKEFIVETTRGKWFQNIAGAGFTALFTGGATIITGIAGAGWGVMLENELVSYLEDDLHYQRVKPVSQSWEENDITETTSTQWDIQNPDHQKVIAELEAEIDKLEIAFTDDILTKEEFDRKKAVLEKQIDDYEVNFVVEEKINKLQEAFSQGILDQSEFEEKVSNLEANTRQQILQARHLQRNKAKIIKLKEALDNGIITQAEFEQKMTNLS